MFHPVEPYRHTMQGYIENLVKQIKVHSRTGLSDAEIEALHKTKIRQPTRVSARVQEAQNPPREVAKGNEQALDPATHADATDFILEATDKALATFSAKRNLVLDLQKDAFIDRAPQVKCVDTSVRNGRVYITLETVRGENPALTAQEQGLAQTLRRPRSLPIFRGGERQGQESERRGNKRKRQRAQRRPQN